MIEIPLVALDADGHTSCSMCTQLRLVIRTDDEVIAPSERQVVSQRRLLVDILTITPLV